jgi:RHS repeat-associated protein
MKTFQDTIRACVYCSLATLAAHSAVASTNAPVAQVGNEGATNSIALTMRIKNPDCPTCAELTDVKNGSVYFTQGFGRTPRVEKAPQGRMMVYEMTAARLPEGANVLRFDHPMMRRIVERDDENGIVAVEEGNGWIVVYRDGVPTGWSTGSDLAIRRDEGGQWIEQLEDRTLVFYGDDNIVDHLVTSAGVRLDRTNWDMDVVWDGAAIGQVWSKTDGLMDVAKLSQSSFRLSWYPPAAVGDKENGRYVTTGGPAKTFTFAYSKVGSEHRYALREYRNEQFNFDYLWTTENGIDWTLIRDPDGLRIVDRKESTITGGIRSIRRTHSDAAGHSSVSTETHAIGLIGATEIGRGALDGTGQPLVEWTASRGEYGGAAGRLVCVTNEWGGVTENAYDRHGRLVSEMKTVFGNLLQVTTNLYSEALVDGFVDRRPRRVTETRNGVVTKDTAYDYGFSPDGGRCETIVRTDPVSGAERIFVRDHYPVDATNAAARGRVRFLSAEDGSATWYDYTAGANDSIVETATHGYRTADGSFAILPSRSTRDITIYNFRGDAVRVERYAHTGAAFELTKWINYTYSLPHKQTGYEDSIGFRESSDWICSGPVWQNLADGTAVTNAFDRAKRISSTTKYTPFGTVEERFTRDAEDRIVAIDIYTNGVFFGSTTKTFDARGRLVRETDLGGRETTTAYSTDNRTVTTTAPGGAVKMRRLNSDGSDLVVSGDANPYTTYERGVDAVTGLHWREIRTAQDPESPSVLKNREWHDALGDLVRVERGAPSGKVWTTCYGYNAKGFRTAEQDYSATETNRNDLLPLGPSTVYAYDPLGFRRSMTCSAGGESRETATAMAFFSDEGSVFERTTVTNSTSDASIPGLVETAVEKLWPLSQDETLRLVTTDVRGNRTIRSESFDRSAAAKTVHTAVPGSTNDAVKIYVAGKLVRETDSAGVLVRFGYDPLRRRVSRMDGRGFTTTYDLDSLGQIVARTDPDGSVTSNEYDRAGRLVSVTDPNGNVARYAYDVAGRRVAQWGAEFPAFFAYDAYGRRVAMATTRDASLVVDPADLPDLSEPSDALDVTRWILDEASGLETKRIYPDGNGPEYVYDTDGALLRRTWVRGVETDYDYDAWRQLAGKTFSDGTPAIRYSYDALGRFSSATAEGVATNAFVYDAFGSVLAEGQFAGTLTNVWDGFGRRVFLGPADGDGITVGYAGNGRPASLAIGETVLSFEDLSGSDMVAAMRSDDGFSWKREYGFRTLFPETITNSWGESALLESENAFDPAGRIASRHDAQGTNDWTTVLGYDGRSEIVSAVENGVTVFAKAYDPSGNRTDAGANSLGQATATGVYDADGNLVSTTNGWSYVWDAENRLVSATNATVAVRYLYDALGRMVRREVTKPGTSETHDFLWDGETILRESVSGAEPSSTTYAWNRPEQDASRSERQVRELFAVCRNGAMFYPLHDAAGTIRGYADSQGDVVAAFRYDPFGKSLSDDGSQSDSFTFRYTDVAKAVDTGLYEYLFRQYDAAIGRWLSRDPFDEPGFNALQSNRRSIRLRKILCGFLVQMENAAASLQAVSPKTTNGLLIRWMCVRVESRRLFAGNEEQLFTLTYAYLANSPTLLIEWRGLDCVPDKYEIERLTFLAYIAIADGEYNGLELLLGISPITMPDDKPLYFPELDCCPDPLAGLDTVDIRISNIWGLFPEDPEPIGLVQIDEAEILFGYFMKYAKPTLYDDGTFKAWFEFSGPCAGMININYTY